MSGKRLNWNSLVEQAREDSAPQVDVTEQVADALQRATVLQVGDWTTLLAAGASVAAAVLMLVSLQAMGIHWSDPFGDWLSAMVVVMT